LDDRRRLDARLDRLRDYSWRFGRRNELITARVIELFLGDRDSIDGVYLARFALASPALLN
jgi:hypothetical protein